MDLNVKIINEIERYPQLYQKNVNLKIRQQCWDSLAKILDMQPHILSARWSLMTKSFLKYQNSYKYASQMQYMMPYIRSMAATRQVTDQVKETDPEFVIDENTLKNEDDETSSDCEFVELSASSGVAVNNEAEVSADDGASADEEPLAYETPSADESAVEDDVAPADEVTLINEKLQENNDHLRIASVETVSHSVFDGESSDNKTPSPKSDMLVEEEQISKENKTPQQQRSAKRQRCNESDDDEQPDQKKEIPRQHEPRSEDDIFGELVSAMLKGMSPSKKRQIKKDIMQILLEF